jgi:GxxExxY protein
VKKLRYKLKGLAEIAENAEIFYSMTINQISYQIRGAVYDVYKTLGPGLLESVYEEALVYELQQRGLKVERQKQVPIIYKGNTLKSELRLDLLVEDQVIVELKSVAEMKDVFYKQTLTYLRLLDKRLGLLVNFNVDNILDGAITRVANNL